MTDLSATTGGSSSSAIPVSVSCLKCQWILLAKTYYNGPKGGLGVASLALSLHIFQFLWRALSSTLHSLLSLNKRFLLISHHCGAACTCDMAPSPTSFHRHEDFCEDTAKNMTSQPFVLVKMSLHYPRTWEMVSLRLLYQNRLWFNSITGQAALLLLYCRHPAQGGSPIHGVSSTTKTRPVATILTTTS